MPFYTLFATSAFGHESMVSQELNSLGYNNLKVENGKVTFAGDDNDIARCNIWLRTADRLYMQMAQFTALDFEELYQGALAIPWEKYIPENGKMHVVGKSLKSKLFSVPDCQSIVKRGVVDAMKRKYTGTWFSEDGPVFKIEIAILKDIATIAIDTSGAGLHKRGYREGKGEAPLRETLAASLVLLSRWTPNRIFADPLCGSGTIAIEAAMIGKNIAPGLKRVFAAEEWGFIPKKVWENAREAAYASVNETNPVILASDFDTHVFRKARENAVNAGVSEYITFQKKPVEEFSSKKTFGCIVCNPPYGERMSDIESVERLYRNMGDVFSRLETWSYFIISSHLRFQEIFGKRADKNRKLYNGNIKTYLYQYFGPLPKGNLIQESDPHDITN